MNKNESGSRADQPSPRQLARRRGEYGIDAPYVPIMLGAIGIFLLIPGAIFIWVQPILVLGIIFSLYALLMLLSAASYIYCTRRGKFQVWADILVRLNLQGNEQVIDLGCGRGAVLLMAADLLPEGKATGIDIWKTIDQSGNAMGVTKQNAELEGVAGRVDLRTADMQSLPFAENSFDVLLSSLAIHNIPAAADRDKVLVEATRVLKPGGRLAIADIRNTQEYAKRLRELGQSEVVHHRLGWRFWYGSPWVATKLVTSRKPL